jgi:KDO2-lipid IV(A) lauroyltransferase
MRFYAGRGGARAALIGPDPMNALLEMLIWLFSRMSLNAARAAGRGMGWFAGSVLRRRRREAREALRAAFPDRATAERRRVLAAVYAHQGMNAAEWLRVMGRGVEEFAADFRIEGEEHLQAARASGHGLLFLTAHTGNWELAGLLFARHGYPFTIMVKEMGYPYLQRKWNDCRARHGMDVLPARHGYRTALRQLRNNAHVMYALDQNMRRSKGIFVDFLGRPACTSPGLAYLSAQAQAPVVPLFCVRRESNAIHLLVQSPMDPPPNTRDESIHAATQAYTRVIESVVREYPEQWLWLHRRWKIQPRPEPGAEADEPETESPDSVSA